jgi:hypothetical protein
MEFLFNLLLVLVWLYVVCRGIWLAFMRREKSRWFTSGMVLLVLIGFGGFFGIILASQGILKFPNSFECPAGYVHGAMRMPDGNYAVPLPPFSRLQIYDAHWKFLRGWYIDSGGRRFIVECPETGGLEVYTG